MNPSNQEALSSLQTAVTASAQQTPVQVDIVRDLQSQIFGFVGEHLRKIDKMYRLRDKVQAKIEENIDNNQYTPDQLLGFFRMLTQESASNTDMIVSLFRPAPGVESFLAKNLSEDKGEKDKEKSARDLMMAAPSDLLQKVDQLFRYMQSGSAGAIAAAKASGTSEVPQPRLPLMAENDTDDEES